MKQQNYLCEGCGLESHVEYQDGAGVWEVVQKIADDHRHWSPECERTYRELRLASRPSLADVAHAHDFPPLTKEQEQHYFDANLGNAALLSPCRRKGE